MKIPTTTDENTEQLRRALVKFTVWLDGYGETSWDHQSYYAGFFGRGAKGLY